MLEMASLSRMFETAIGLLRSELADNLIFGRQVTATSHAVPHRPLLAGWIAHPKRRSHRRHPRNAPSIAVAAWRSFVGSLCTYKSLVTRTVECPRMSAIMGIGTPAAYMIDAELCRRSWVVTRGSPSR